VCACVVRGWVGGGWDHDNGQKVLFMMEKDVVWDGLCFLHVQRAFLR
jgi:hypothetical protein